MKGIRGTWDIRNSIPMKYDPRVMVTNWHEAREQHPLDYDYGKPENKDLQRSSYRNFWFGDPAAPLPKSTAHEMMDEALDWHGRKKILRHPYLDMINWDGSFITDRRDRNIYPRGASTPISTDGRPFVSYTQHKVPIYDRRHSESIGTQTPGAFWWMDHDESTSPKDIRSYKYVAYPKWHRQDYVLYPCYEPWSMAHRVDRVLKNRKPERFLL